MFEEITSDKIGTTLLDNTEYRCQSGSREFTATFCYCPEEYWWVDPISGKEVHVSRFLPNEPTTGQPCACADTGETGE
jgi:hypothetical protein